MAKQVLPVNFKDDILASSMGGKRRYNLIQNDDGTYSLEDATEYTQTGSDFGAGQINDTNKAVNESCDKADVIDDWDDLVANQADGKIAGVLAVKRIKNIIVEEGSNSNGKYRKWSDGTLEMWGDFDRSAAITEKAGSLYASSPLSITYPLQSLTRPNINLTVTAGGAIWGHPWDSASGYLRDFSYQLLSAIQWPNASYHVSYYAKGTWK